MILLTGGSGHLGANLLRRLVEIGHGGPKGLKIRALYRRGSDNRGLDGLPPGAGVERFEGDLRDREAMARAMKGVTHVYHCAAKVSTVAGGEREIFDCNVVGTRNLLDAAREHKVKRVVVTGSFSAVGHLNDRPSDEDVPFYPFEHVLAYEFTKSYVELECWRAAAAGLETVVATSCAILGPHDYKPSRMGGTLVAYAQGKLPAYIPGGFEFVASRDIVEGHLLAMEKGRSGQKYIFASGYTTVDELMDHFHAVTGAPKPRLRLPPPVMLAVATVASPIMTRFFPHVRQRLTPDAVRLLGMGRRADTTKAQKELGFKPTPVREAILAAYEDFVRRGVLVARPGHAVAPAPPLAPSAPIKLGAKKTGEAGTAPV